MYPLLVGIDLANRTVEIPRHRYRVARRVGKSRQKAAGGWQNLINRRSGVDGTIRPAACGCLERIDGFRGSPDRSVVTWSDMNEDLIRFLGPIVIEQRRMPRQLRKSGMPGRYSLKLTTTSLKTSSRLGRSELLLEIAPYSAEWSIKVNMGVWDIDCTHNSTRFGGFPRKMTDEVKAVGTDQNAILAQDMTNEFLEFPTMSSSFHDRTPPARAVRQMRFAWYASRWASRRRSSSRSRISKLGRTPASSCT